MTIKQPQWRTDTINTKLCCIFLLSFMVLAFAPIASSTEPAEKQTIIAEDAWSPETPPMIKISAVYLKLNNLRKIPLTVTGVSSPNFNMAHLHKTTTDEGLTTMQAVDQLTIPAGQSAEFKPNGMHIMLMGAKKPHKIGDEIQIVLKLQNGTEYKFAAIVKKASHYEKPHDHNKMKSGM